MISSNHVVPWVSVVVFIVMAAGCGRNANTGLVPVTGSVTHGGAPVDGASVVFRSDQNVASGLTDASGKFVLQTVNRGRGAEPGSYKAIVMKVGTVSDVEMPDMEEAAEQPWTGDAGGMNQLPERFGDFARTPLEFTVTEGGTNDFKIELE